MTSTTQLNHGSIAAAAWQFVPITKLSLAQARDLLALREAEYRATLQEYFRGRATQGEVGIARIARNHLASLCVDLTDRRARPLENLVRLSGTRVA